MSDGYAYEDLDSVKELFCDADVIFKRSYSNEKNCALGNNGEKIHPYGLNYFVTFPDNPITSRKSSLKGILKTVKLTNSYVEDFEAPILRERKNPKSLFLTRLWELNGSDIAGNGELAEERNYINKVRTDTVRLLKKEFGKAFYGGIYADEFSVEYCLELLVDKTVSLKRLYLNRMKNSDICINTMRLHGSTGWKTAEYAAASRAIVSEKFIYETPGDFSDGKNYLSFTSPQECAEKVSFLLENPSERVFMSEQNKKCYEKYLRPDAQVMRAIENVFGRKIDV